MSVARTCKVCGTEFSVFPSILKRKGKVGLFCSKKCKGVDMVRAEQRRCPTCGNDFVARRSQIKQGYGNYCSKACWAKQNVTSTIVSCVQCGKEMLRPPWLQAQNKSHFCSYLCAALARRTLAHGRRNMFRPWQVREWLDSKCAACGATERLELDHIIPRLAGGKPERSNAQTLCKRCNIRKYREGDLPYYTWLRAHSPEQDVGKSSLIDLEGSEEPTGRKQVLDRAA